MNPHPIHSQAWFQEEFKIRGGRDVCEWTLEERSILFGDCNPNRDIEKKEKFDNMLIERYKNGLPMSKKDKKTARRLIKERS